MALIVFNCLKAVFLFRPIVISRAKWSFVGLGITHILYLCNCCTVRANHDCGFSCWDV